VPISSPSASDDQEWVFQGNSAMVKEGRLTAALNSLYPPQLERLNLREKMMQLKKQKQFGSGILTIIGGSYLPSLASSPFADQHGVAAYIPICERVERVNFDPTIRLLCKKQKCPEFLRPDTAYNAQYTPVIEETVVELTRVILEYNNKKKCSYRFPVMKAGGKVTKSCTTCIKTPGL